MPNWTLIPIWILIFLKISSPGALQWKPHRSSFAGHPPVLLFDYHPAVGEELIGAGRDCWKTEIASVFFFWCVILTTFFSMICALKPLCLVSGLPIAMFNCRRVECFSDLFRSWKIHLSFKLSPEADGPGSHRLLWAWAPQWWWEGCRKFCQVGWSWLVLKRWIYQKQTILGEKSDRPLDFVFFQLCSDKPRHSHQATSLFDVESNAYEQLTVTKESMGCSFRAYLTWMPCWSWALFADW